MANQSDNVRAVATPSGRSFVFYQGAQSVARFELDVSSSLNTSERSAIARKIAQLLQTTADSKKMSDLIAVNIVGRSSGCEACE